MEKSDKTDKIDILLTLPETLNEKIQTLAKDEKRSRHSQILFILEKHCFKNGNGANKKEVKK